MMVTEQLNVPVAVTVAPHAEIDAPVLIDVVTVRPGVNPVPETVTVTPLGPWLGASDIAGVVIVKSAVAASKLPSDPVAVTTYGVAEAVPVRVVEQLKVPVPVTVAEQLVSEAPVEIDAVIEAPGVNPVPEIVTLAPLGPWLGESVIDGVVTE